MEIPNDPWLWIAEYALHYNESELVEWLIAKAKKGWFFLLFISSLKIPSSLSISYMGLSYLINQSISNS